MSNERYPLRVAERMRNAQRARAEQALAAAHTERSRAHAEVEDIERASYAHLGRTPVQAEGGAQKTIGAQELQRQAAFAQRHGAEARALRARLAAARAGLAACEVALRAAQAELSQARAAEHAIEREHARFDAIQRRDSEHAEQSEIEDQVERSRNDRGDR